MDRLEIGGGSNPTEGYLNLDINADCKPDITGDVRAFFTPDVNLKDHPELMEIEDSEFDEIKATHFVEHIEWIYQKPMFEWVYRMLRPRGRVFIETHNLRWIIKSYLKNYGSRTYPSEDHSDLNGPNDFVPWVNFKLFSGCSPGDYHHAMFDKIWMKQILKETGFTPTVKAKGAYIQAIGVKKDQGLPEEEYFGSSNNKRWWDMFRMGSWIK